MKTAVSLSHNAESYVEAYEQAQVRDGSADLAQFLPPADDPLYLPVLRELACLELEYSWKRRAPRLIEDLGRAFPILLRDSESLQALAFEEYRWRLQVGERPAREDYQRRYGVRTDTWPDAVASSEVVATKDTARVHVRPVPVSTWRMDDQAMPHLEDAARAFQRFMQRNGHSADMAAWRDSQRGDVVGAELFAQLHSRDPNNAARFAQALTSMPAVGDEVFGFRLVAELGKGAFARVFLAEQVDLGGRLVVLKVSADEGPESLLLAQLQHTNIVPIYSFHRSGCFHAVCMPFFGATTLADVLQTFHDQPSVPASGEGLVSTLNDLISTHNPLPPEPNEANGTNSTSHAKPASPAADKRMSRLQSPLIREHLKKLTYVDAVLWIGSRLAEGLVHAHERGILHRDLKPANILLTDEGQPMLLDFNLAQDTKLRASASAALIGGTLPYMSPEQLEAYRGDQRTLTPGSDVYSLGVILYELLTGRHPFGLPRGPIQNVLDEMIGDRRLVPELRRWNRAVSPAVESIIRRCLQPDPARRYQSARELKEDLDRQRAHLPLRHAPEPSLAERAHKWVRRHPRLASSSTIASIAGLMLVGMLTLLLARSHRIGELEASESLQHFLDHTKQVQFLLTSPAIEPEYMQEGIKQCHRALDRYHVLDNPRWMELPGVRQLSPDDQRRLRDAVGDMLFLLARATGVKAHGEKDLTKKADELDHALSLIDLAEANLAQNEPSQAVLLQRVELLMLRGREQEARELKARADELPLRTPRDRFLTARLYALQDRFRDAMPLVQEITQEDPAHFWGWCVLGYCYESEGRVSEARGCYSTCIALAPRFPWMYFNRGLAHARLGDANHAAADFDRAIALRPGRWDFHFNRALARKSLNRLGAALEDVNRALELGMPYTRVYFLRAMVREQLGDRGGAAEDRAEGMRRDPPDNDDKGWILRGRARPANELEQAIADYDKALEINPRSREALQNKVNALARLKRNEAALEVAHRVVELYPDFVLARSGRAILLARLKRRDAALEDAKDCLARDSSPQTAFQLAGVYALTSRENPDDRPEAFRLLAGALLRGFGLEHIDRDRDLDPIRDTIDFRRIVAAARALHGSAGPAKQ